MALIPPFSIDCVVALGVEAGDGTTSWIASGFLYLNVASRDGDQATGRAYLVTNRHVVIDHSDLVLRFNPQGDELAPRDFPLALRREDGSQLWTGHPDPTIDVAVIPVNFDLLQREAMQVDLFMSDAHAAPLEKIRNTGLTEGDGVFVLGFPMGMVGDVRNAVIVRRGAIARIRDVLAGASNRFLVDAFVFPGNSGGPVITRPETGAIAGAPTQDKTYLIGIVTGYVPYREPAVSSQTGQIRVVFEDNTGLAAVHPVDYVNETIEEHMRNIPAKPTKAEEEETIEKQS